MTSRLCFMAVSHSRSRTKTILASFSGMASMAMLRPERPGPIRAHCSSSVPAPAGRRVNRQVAIGWPGSPTVQVKRRGGSHSVIVLIVSHVPRYSLALRPVNRRPGAGPVTPSSQATCCSSELSSAISVISLTRSHTRSGGASMRIWAAAVGQSAYTCPVHSMKSRLEPHCGSRLNRGTTSLVITAQAQPAAAGDPAASAPAIHVTGLRKRYGDVTALADVDLVVRAGEFFTLLGPSGSGKTTLLRLIAGFERPDAGRIELGGRDVTQVPPYARDVNTVFQDYALFPHMTVAQNIEYGLRVRRVARAERREKTGRALEMVRLPGLGLRKPAQLSGGQRQRVALARAIVNEPQVLLLDEPLGALDLKLRQEMQLELQRVQRVVGITFVYVTHDQEEALTMSDRIAVLSQGRIEQTGGPVELYERPRTAFVAGFIGVSNLIERDGHTITVRPEKITLVGDGEADPPGMHVEPGRIKDVIYAGVLTRYVVDLDGGGELVVSRPNTEAPAPGDLRGGHQVRIAWRPEQAFTIPSREGP